MKLIYIAAVDSKKPESFGVGKKIVGQVKALNKLNVESELVNIENDRVNINGKVVREKLKKPKYMFFHKYLIKNYNEIFKDKECVYIRYYSNDIFLYYLIKKLKKDNKKIVLEIPTYPLDVTNNGFIKKIVYEVINIYVRKNLKKYVDYISTTNSNYDEIYGIETIKINNGIDIVENKVVNKKKSDNIIRLVAVANLSKWHGYDRVITGIGKYNKNINGKKKVVFHIVGEGAEKENLINLSNRLQLNDFIHFEGAKSGEALDNIFNQMDIGVSSLALFRAGGGHDPIKTKEFLARGLPVVLGYDDKLVDMSLPYVIKVPENDEPIDIDEIVERFNNLNDNCYDIRKYAEENLSWESQMNKIINKINREKK